MRQAKCDEDQLSFACTQRAHITMHKMRRANAFNRSGGTLAVVCTRATRPATMGNATERDQIIEDAHRERQKIVDSAREQALSIGETVEKQAATVRSAADEAARTVKTATEKQVGIATEAAAEQTKRNYNLMNSAQLKGELAARKLAATGSLDEMRARLKDADAKA